MAWLFTVMAIFIEYPLLAAAIGLLLVALGRWMHRGLTIASLAA